MADYDSDSSAGGDDIETNVLLGYASKDPTGDDFSQLGGHPTWLDGSTAPSPVLTKCKACNGLMNLVLQINGDLPDRFPGHERRLYIWTCRKKSCRRKEGSVRGFRATRQTTVGRQDVKAGAVQEKIEDTAPSASTPAPNLGETLFGVKSPSSTQANPFAALPSNPFAAGGGQSNLFASASSLAAKPPQKLDTGSESLPQTFAEKARISSSTSDQTPQPKAQLSQEPWPAESCFPKPFPTYHLDADKEYIDAEPDQIPSSVRVERDSGEGSSGGSIAEDKLAFESSMDKTFQRFADRLAQNPEQVLRYEYKGQPLLYSKMDAVGKILAPAQDTGNAKVKVQSSSSSGASRILHCTNCGAERVFELQLTPHAIAELESDEISVDGMDWGTIMLRVCSNDCQQAGKSEGEVGYVEEWTGVQWEELASNRRPT